VGNCPFCQQDISLEARKCPHCHEWVAQTPRTAELRDVERDLNELAERRVSDAVRTNVEKELVRRYSWIGLIVAALTGGTIALLVNSALLDTRQNLAAAEALQERSVKSLDELDKSLHRMKQLEGKLRELSNQASGTESKFQELQVLSVSLRRDQYSSSSDILQVARGLESRVDALTSVVQELSLTPAQRAQLQQRGPATLPTNAILADVLQRAKSRLYQISNYCTASI
jgi:DNA repair exonuclease SbcCD ATPase subunit